jgi:succinyl-CoA synthetase beta subunit
LSSARGPARGGGAALRRFDFGQKLCYFLEECARRVVVPGGIRREIMKIHEYQSKQILAKFGVRVPRGDVAATPAEARAVAERVGPRVVVKAQIHAGGRGKGGGVKLAATPAEAEAVAAAILGMRLVTHQTGPEGKIVKRVLVEEAKDIARELYLGLVIDRARESAVLMASTEGGVEIEKVAAESPERIFKEYVDPAVGLLGFQARRLAFKLGLGGETLKQGQRFIAALYKAFEGTDASLAEINPLLVTRQGEVLALDAKMNFDDNALGRHPEIQAMRDLDEESPLEVEASKYNLNYIKLDGNVGCMVNGAGLAMATMDIIKYSGGMPANFLDVGGGVTEEAVTNAFRILVSDPDVKGALINIFGGIVRCDMIANGVVKAAKALGTKIPVVIRLEGTNVEQGKRILAESGLAFSSADGMKEAAERIVGLVR